jgi:rhamnosyltransferase
MGSTDLNMLLDVCFNQEVGGDSALYWTKDQGSLARLINYADNIKQGDIVELGVKAKKRIMKEYSWEYIVKTYEDVFYACFRKSGK